jgi:hypothetical protein
MSAASSINKLLDWLQPPFIPALDDSSGDSSGGFQPPPISNQPAVAAAQTAAAAAQAAANQAVSQMGTTGQQAPLAPGNNRPQASRVHQLAPGVVPKQQQQPPLHFHRQSLDDQHLNPFATGLGGAAVGGLNSISSGGALVGGGGTGKTPAWEGQVPNGIPQIHPQQRVVGAPMFPMHSPPMLPPGMGIAMPQQHQAPFYPRAAAMPPAVQMPMGYDLTFQQQPSISDHQVVQQLAGMGLSSEVILQVLQQMPAAAQQLNQQHQHVSQALPNLSFGGMGTGDTSQMAQLQAQLLQMTQAFGYLG